MESKITQAIRALIVDDDTDDCELFTEALAGVNAATVCYTASDGAAAIKKLTGNEIERPDIIFLDINMPVMDGWECLSQLKANDRLKDIPVIMHTTSSLEKDRNIARKLGALCFITKHSDFKILKRMLEIVVSKMTNQELDTLCHDIYSSLNLAN